MLLLGGLDLPLEDPDLLAHIQDLPLNLVERDLPELSVRAEYTLLVHGHLLQGRAVPAQAYVYVEGQACTLSGCSTQLGFIVRVPAGQW